MPVNEFPEIYNAATIKVFISKVASTISLTLDMTSVFRLTRLPG